MLGRQDPGVCAMAAEAGIAAMPCLGQRRETAQAMPAAAAAAAAVVAVAQAPPAVTQRALRAAWADMARITHTLAPWSLMQAAAAAAGGTRLGDLAEQAGAASAEGTTSGTPVVVRGLRIRAAAAAARQALLALGADTAAPAS